MVRRKFSHVADPYHLKAAPFRSENVATSRPEDGSLPDLRTILQAPEPTALAEVLDQVYETLLSEEVCHSLAPQDTRFFKVPEDNGFPEAFQVFLQVRQVIHR